MTGRYDAVLFDLFGTLIAFDTGALPEVELDGRRVRSTIGAWRHLVAEALPDLELAAFVRAIADASAELDRIRSASTVGFPSRERFRRALARVGCTGDAAEELAPVFARAHMRGIAAATRFPPDHARVLAAASARGPVAVITNFDDTAAAYEILGQHGILSHATTVVVSEAVGLRKPNGALVRMALRDVGVEPARAVMVGDHALEDVGAAAAAGVDAVWIDAAGVGVAAGRPQPRWIVRSLPEVEAILA